MTDPRAKVLTPDQMKLYVEALQFRSYMNAHNAEMLLAGMVVGGMVAAAAGGSSNVGQAGAITTGVGALASLGRNIDQQRTNATYAGLHYGKEHLLREATKIPGELFVRRTLLLDTGGAELSNMVVCFAAPTEQCLTVDIATKKPQKVRASAQPFDI